MTQHAVPHTRPAPQRRPGVRGAERVIQGYELRIEGHLDDHWSAWFGGLTLIREDDGTTTLRGAVTDQSELHGLLAKVRDLGVTLISLASIQSVQELNSDLAQER